VHHYKVRSQAAETQGTSEVKTSLPCWPWTGLKA